MYKSANVAHNKVNEAMLHEIALDAGLPEAEKDPDAKIIEEVKEFAQIEGFGPCQRIQNFIHAVGVLCIMACIVFDVAYGFKQVFSSKLVFLIYCGIILVRILVCSAIQVFYCAAKMFQQPKDDQQAVEGEAVEANEYRKRGVMLYLGLPMALLTGSFRLTARKQFLKEVTFGFVVDIIYIVAMFYI